MFTNEVDKSSILIAIEELRRYANASPSRPSFPNDETQYCSKSSHPTEHCKLSSLTVEGGIHFLGTSRISNGDRNVERVQDRARRNSIETENAR